MRWMIPLVVSLVSLTSALLSPAQAQQPLVRAAARHVPMPTFEVVDYKLQCPPGYVPNNYSHTPQYPYDINEDQFRLFIDSSGAVVDKNTVSSIAPLVGAGYSLSVNNAEHHDKNLQALALCISTGASADNTFQLVRVAGSVARNTVGTINAFCPADSPVAFGGFSNADDVLNLDYGSAPLWGTAASPTVLSSVPDGTTGPPTGWQVRVYSILGNASLSAVALCGKAPTMQTFVYSTSAPGSTFGLPTPFTLYAPLPDGFSAVNMGYDGGTQALYLSTDVWMDDGTVVTALQWYPTTSTYDSGTSQVRAFMAHANGTGSGGRGVLAVLALPQPGAQPPSTQVQIVEYYHAGLDHYFITANPDEQAKLDDGTFKGWARTGETFNAYGAGSGGRSTSRRPVCREYGNPIYGLDSHFYSASPDECAASMVNTGGAWILEASEVFQIDLPTAAGACPAGTAPVYRVWNKRRDSNHRYTTKTAIRDQMVAKGGVAEGYGANAVALCGLP